jgi:hypothetical protein
MGPGGAGSTPARAVEAPAKADLRHLVRMIDRDRSLAAAALETLRSGWTEVAAGMLAQLVGRPDNASVVIRQAAWGDRSKGCA